MLSATKKLTAILFLTIFLGSACMGVLNLNLSSTPVTGSSTAPTMQEGPFGPNQPVPRTSDIVYIPEEDLFHLVEPSPDDSLTTYDYFSATEWEELGGTGLPPPPRGVWHYGEILWLSDTPIDALSAVRSIETFDAGVKLIVEFQYVTGIVADAVSPYTAHTAFSVYTNLHDGNSHGYRFYVEDRSGQETFWIQKLDGRNPDGTMITSNVGGTARVNYMVQGGTYRWEIWVLRDGTLRWWHNYESLLSLSNTDYSNEDGKIALEVKDATTAKYNFVYVQKEAVFTVSNELEDVVLANWYQHTSSGPVEQTEFLLPGEMFHFTYLPAGYRFDISVTTVDGLVYEQTYYTVRDRYLRCGGGNVDTNRKYFSLYIEGTQYNEDNTLLRIYDHNLDPTSQPAWYIRSMYDSWTSDSLFGIRLISVEGNAVVYENMSIVYSPIIRISPQNQFYTLINSEKTAVNVRQTPNYHFSASFPFTSDTAGEAPRGWIDSDLLVNPGFEDSFMSFYTGSWPDTYMNPGWRVESCINFLPWFKGDAIPGYNGLDQGEIGSVALDCYAQPGANFEIRNEYEVPGSETYYGTLIDTISFGYHTNLGTLINTGQNDFVYLRVKFVNYDGSIFNAYHISGVNPIWSSGASTFVKFHNNEPFPIGQDGNDMGTEYGFSVSEIEAEPLCTAFNPLNIDYMIVSVGVYSTSGNIRPLLDDIVVNAPVLGYLPDSQVLEEYGGHYRVLDTLDFSEGHYSSQYIILSEEDYKGTPEGAQLPSIGKISFDVQTNISMNSVFFSFDNFFKVKTDQNGIVVTKIDTTEYSTSIYMPRKEWVHFELEWDYTTPGSAEITMRFRDSEFIYAVSDTAPYRFKIGTVSTGISRVVWDTINFSWVYDSKFFEPIYPGTGERSWDIPDDTLMEDFIRRGSSYIVGADDAMQIVEADPYQRVDVFPVAGEGGFAVYLFANNNTGSIVHNPTRPFRLIIDSMYYNTGNIELDIIDSESAEGGTGWHGREIQVIHRRDPIFPTANKDVFGIRIYDKFTGALCYENLNHAYSQEITITINAVDLFNGERDPVTASWKYRYMDPVFRATYYGGSSIDRPAGFGIDGSNNMFLTGTTRSSDYATTVGSLFPNQPYTSGTYGSDNGFVTYMAGDGEQVFWSTYFGGTAGLTLITAGEIDYAGNFVFTGITMANDLPTLLNPCYDPSFNSPPGGADAFVAKVDSSGNLLWCTYLGGSTGSLSPAFDLAIDTDNSIYVIGSTDCSDFPTTGSAYQPTFNGGTDYFISKISSDGTSLLYSTFLGTTTWEDDYASIVSDSTGIYVTFATENDLWTPSLGAYQTARTGGYDLFVTKLAKDLSTSLWGTYLGGTWDDRRYSNSWEWPESDLGKQIGVDESGNVHVVGMSESGDYPTTFDALRPDPIEIGYSWVQEDPIYSVLSSDGTSLIYSTWVGGSRVMGDDGTFSVINDLEIKNGNITFCGETFHPDFPVTEDAVQREMSDVFDWVDEGTGIDYHEQMDGFILRMDLSDFSVRYGTFVGGYENPKFSSGCEYLSEVSWDGGENYYFFGATNALDAPVGINAVMNITPSDLVYPTADYYNVALHAGSFGGIVEEAIRAVTIYPGVHVVFNYVRQDRFPTLILDHTLTVTGYYGNELLVNVYTAPEIDSIYLGTDTRTVLIRYLNERSEYVNWQTFSTYINDTETPRVIYDQYVTLPVGKTFRIETKDVFGISLLNTTYTVQVLENVATIILPMYSLKIFNQASEFVKTSVQRDPLYYTSEFVWRGWMAPDEIEEHFLYEGHYLVNISGYEDRSPASFSYYLTEDDILLISSGNTIFNVLQNLEYINTTVGTQLTNIQINLTNIDSQIGNQSVILEVNFLNMNTTLDDMLVSISADIQAIESTFNNSVLLLNTSIANLNSSLLSQILLTELNIINQITAVNVTNATAILEQVIITQQNINNQLNSNTSTILNQLVQIQSDLVNNIENVNETILNQVLQSQNLIVNELANGLTSNTSFILNQIIDTQNSILNNLTSALNSNTTYIINQLIDTQNAILNEMANGLNENTTYIITQLVNSQNYIVSNLSADINNGTTYILNQMIDTQNLILTQMEAGLNQNTTYIISQILESQNQIVSNLSAAMNSNTTYLVNQIINSQNNIISQLGEGINDNTTFIIDQIINSQNNIVSQIANGLNENTTFIVNQIIASQNDIISQFAEGINENTTFIINQIIGAQNNIVSEIGSGINTNTSYIINQILNTQSQIVSQIGEGLNENTTFVINQILLTQNQIVSNLTNVNASVINQVIDSQNIILSSIEAGGNSTIILNQILNTQNEIVNSINNTETAILTAMLSVQNTMLSNLQNINESILTELVSIHTDLSNTMNGINESIIFQVLSIETAIINSVNNTGSSILTELISITAQITNNLQNINQSLITELLNVQLALTNRLDSVNESVITAITTTSIAVLNSINNTENSILTNLVSVQANVINSLENVNQSIIFEMLSIEARLASVLNGVNQSVINEVLTSHNSIVNTVNNTEVSIIGHLLDVQDQLINNIENVNQSVTEAVLSVQNAVINNLFNLNSTLVNKLLYTELLLNDTFVSLNDTLTGVLDTITLNLESLNSTLTGLLAEFQINLNGTLSDLTANINFGFQTMNNSFNWININFDGNFTELSQKVDNIFYTFDNSLFPEDFDYLRPLDPQKQIIGIQNQFVDDSVIIEVANKWTGEISEIRMAAENSKDVLLSNEQEYRYRIKSVATGDYLPEWTGGVWTDVGPDTKNITVGWYEGPAPEWKLPSGVTGLTDPADFTIALTTTSIAVAIGASFFTRVLSGGGRGDGSPKGRGLTAFLRKLRGTRTVPSVPKAA